MSAKIIVVNEKRCLACNSCVVACAMAHTEAQTLAEAVTASPRPQPRVHLEPLGEFAVPLQCRHCRDAPCVAICPTGAIHRLTDEGPVLLDEDRCIGCRFCVLICPFGVVDVSRDGKAVIKCDLCNERTSRGEQPACVAACPTGAISFQDIAEASRQKRKAAIRRFLEVQQSGA